MSDIQLYSNEDFTVRSITDTDGTVWFVGKDIAQALEYSEESNPARLFANVPDCWRGVKRIHTLGGEQEMLCLTEQGVYFFLGRSDKPKALPYQMWIAGEVVPSIRATGSYAVKLTPDKISLPVMESAHFLLSTAGIKGNQLTIALDNLFYAYTGHSVLKEGHVELPAPSQRQLLTPTEIGNQLGISPRKVNDILAGAGYQHKIANMWEPLGEGEHYAVMMDVGKRRNAGTPIRQLKWDSAIIEVMKCLLDPDEEEAS